ncbi:MAG: hypothetical protein JWP55_2651 [Mycobacterium sp.]|nr:hypothetical protein [Mycobacterium sp.]
MKPYFHFVSLREPGPGVSRCIRELRGRPGFISRVELKKCSGTMACLDLGLGVNAQVAGPLPERSHLMALRDLARPDAHLVSQLGMGQQPRHR